MRVSRSTRSCSKLAAFGCCADVTLVSKSFEFAPIPASRKLFDNPVEVSPLRIFPAQIIFMASTAIPDCLETSLWSFPTVHSSNGTSKVPDHAPATRTFTLWQLGPAAIALVSAIAKKNQLLQWNLLKEFANALLAQIISQISGLLKRTSLHLTPHPTTSPQILQFVR